MGEQLTDHLLVERVLKGEKNAFNLLVIKYQNRIAHLVSRYVPKAEVQDVLQEIFIKTYRSLATFKGESVFYTWLYRIAVNTAKNHLLSQSRRPPLTDIDVSEAENYSGFEILHDIDNPESLALTEEIKHIVFEAIDALPDDLKIAITLREIEGLSYDEIATKMGTVVGTVRSRIFRAREAIDEKIKAIML